MQNKQKQEEKPAALPQYADAPPTYEMTAWFEATYNSMLQMTPAGALAWMNSMKNEDCKQTMAIVISWQWREKYNQLRASMVQHLLEAMEQGHPCNDQKKKVLMGHLLAA